jgi:formamidopyrimidine-DNA glycosylase
MPELPEVEVVRRGLVAKITNRKITDLIVRREGLRWPFPSDLRQNLLHQRVGSIQRRGKYLLIACESPDSSSNTNTGYLLVHLGMTGSFIWYDVPPKPAAHDHLDIVFEQGVLRYNDPRRFGAILWIDPTEIGSEPSHPLLESLGVEPFEDAFTGELLFRLSRGRKLSVKQFLLAGHAVVGVGNIYCSETLFRAGVRPSRAAGRVTKAEYTKLANAIREILASAIEQGGSTLKDFKNSAGESGYFQLTYFAYDKQGQPCRVCKTPIRLIRQQQRASYFCTFCQK